MGAPNTIYIYVNLDDFTIGFSTETFPDLMRKRVFFQITENLPAYKIMDWLADGIKDCENFQLIQGELP